MRMNKKRQLILSSILPINKVSYSSVANSIPFINAYSALLWQTEVIALAYWKSKQLLLFAFGLLYFSILLWSFHKKAPPPSPPFLKKHCLVSLGDHASDIHNHILYFPN